MKRNITLLILLSLSGFYACSGKLAVQSSPYTSTNFTPTSDSVFLQLEAYNLSEDMSRLLSTKNDELLILVYAYQDSIPLSAPLFQKTLVVNEDKKPRRFFWKQDSLNSDEDLLVMLIEQDFDRPVEQIDPVIRVQYPAILKAYKDRDYQSIKKYLGTEDLLGYKIIFGFRPGEPYRFKIEGVHKLDWYEYILEIGYD